MKTQKYYFKIFYIFSFLLFFSCATPLPVVRLATEDVPANSKRFWFGSEQVFLTYQDIDVVVSFIESSSSDLIFSVEIINQSENEILISPEKIYYQSFKLVDSIKTKITPHYVLARNPEEEILNIDREKSVRDAQADNDATINKLVTLVNVTADITTSLSQNDTEQAQLEREATMQEQEANFQNKQNDYLNATQSLNELRNYWMNNTLRKTHLPSKNSLQGTVLIPRNDKATHLKLVIPIENINFIVDYKQHLK